ncbi:hypothetical protein DMB66_48350 [Actinoplanes sp. ATCC 53533]|uniref:hypothetical protein n=1 Tax=Actinoplanes sp. ATCC 53533 TaxID=1288362 RepID=UPI000F7A78A6|nr:hypothetical protein [Actinoplanes sp. ATCC 53533]RSM47250.1 hypothetical protein DMB66_48350 [Actinoplanes sp. ATCC 53533]
MTFGQPEGQHAPLSDRLASDYRQVVDIHSDDPVVGACLVCRVSRCEDWRFASERLFGFVEQQAEQATVASLPERQSDQS